MKLRLPVFNCAMILAVAACGRQDPVANGANSVTSVPQTMDQDRARPGGGPPTGATPPVHTAPTGSGPASAIPAALQGRWGLSPRDCTSALGDAKGLLVIKSGELRFYESRAVPSPGVQTDADSISGNFSFTGEGQNWTKYETLERRQDRLVRTESNPTASFTYVKC